MREEPYRGDFVLPAFWAFSWMWWRCIVVITRIYQGKKISFARWSLSSLAQWRTSHFYWSANTRERRFIVLSISIVSEGWSGLVTDFFFCAPKQELVHSASKAQLSLPHPSLFWASRVKRYSIVIFAWPIIITASAIRPAFLPCQYYNVKWFYWGYQ